VSTSGGNSVPAHNISSTSDEVALPSPTIQPDTVPPGENPPYIAATTVTSPDGSATVTYPHGDQITTSAGVSIQSGGRGDIDTFTGNGTVVYQLAGKTVAVSTISADGSSSSTVQEPGGTRTSISRSSGGPLSVAVDGRPVATPGIGDTALAAARSYIGIPYAWGGGGEYGPTKGEADNGQGANQFGDFNRIGFDCEGLVRYCVYQSTGHDIGPGTTNQVTSQYLTTIPMTGALGIAGAQPGDLLYFETPPEHVAVYSGTANGAPMMVQAPESGELLEEVQLTRTDLYGIRRPNPPS